MTGCASYMLDIRERDLKSAENAYLEAEPCCSDFSEIEFVKLTPEKSAKFKVGRNGQSFIFDEGKSFFVGIELPDNPGQYTINLETWHTDTAGFSSSLLTAHLLYPSVIFLDENYQKINANNTFEYRYRTWWTTSGLETDINMRRFANAKYLLIYTDPQNFGKFYQATPGSVTFYTGSTLVSTGANAYAIPLSYEGVVNLKARLR